MAQLTDIESIGNIYAEKLHSANIKNIDDLLTKGGDKTGRKRISDASGISEKMILNWVNRADLSRIKGVGTQYADLLEHSGVDTVPELAQRNAESLQNKMLEVNTAKNLVRAVPSTASVESWISQAKDLPRAVHY